MRLLISVRSVVLWHAFIAGIALLAFYAYYQSTDSQTFSVASSSSSASLSSIGTWLGNVQSSIAEAWNGLISIAPAVDSMFSGGR